MERTIRNKISKRAFVWLAVAALVAASLFAWSTNNTGADARRRLENIELINHNAVVTFSSFTYNSGTQQFTGDIDSARQECVENRTVNIFLVLAGSTIGVTPVATATTNSTGGFTSTQFVAAPGSTYRAEVSSSTHCQAATADHTVS